MTSDRYFAGLCHDEFWSRHWGQAPHLCIGASNQFADVLGWRQINEILDNNPGLSPPKLRMLDVNHQPLPMERYFAEDPTSRTGRGSLRRQALYTILHQGGRLVVDDVEQVVPSLHPLLQELMRQACSQRRTILHVSWAERNLQVVRTPAVHSFHVQLLGARRCNWIEDPKGEDVVINAGSVLYLPPSLQYRLAPMGPSIHWQVFLTACTGADYLTWFASQQLDGHALFKKAMPMDPADWRAWLNALHEELDPAFDAGQLSDFRKASSEKLQRRGRFT